MGRSGGSPTPQTCGSRAGTVSTGHAASLPAAGPSPALQLVFLLRSCLHRWTTTPGSPRTSPPKDRCPQPWLTSGR